MPVFISHTTADNAIAGRVHRRLETIHAIECWIDDIDPAVAASRNSARITGLIIDRLERCTNLLAIVTANTRQSWWVPFEIGVARRAPRVISTFTNLPDTDLPEYVHEWPVLRGDSAVDTFASLYKSQRRQLTEGVLEKRASVERQIGFVADFHRSLKMALGQR
jgi:hypothetical protein